MATKQARQTRTKRTATTRLSPREQRYRYLRDDLEEAQRELERRLRDAADDQARSAAVSDFHAEVIRVCRADSRLLHHPVTARVVRQARAFGWRLLLEALPGGLERGMTKTARPLPWQEVELLGAIDTLRSRRGLSLRSAHRILTGPGAAKWISSRLAPTSYQAFHKRVAEAEAVRVRFHVLPPSRLMKALLVRLRRRCTPRVPRSTSKS
jgi:hypothetical protein